MDNEPGVLLKPNVQEESRFEETPAVDFVDPADHNETAEAGVPVMEKHETAGVDNEIDLLAGIYNVINTDKEDIETAQGESAHEEIPGVTGTKSDWQNPGVTEITPMWSDDGTIMGDVEGMPALISPWYDAGSSDDEDDDDDAGHNHGEIPNDEVYHPDSVTPPV
jgi:hypothetical protein